MEVIWSDPQVLAYLNGPAPTHAQDRSQPGCLEKLLATGQALDVFDAELLNLVSKYDDNRRSGTAALIQSKAVLVLGRITHWLQQSLNPRILETGTPTWAGSAIWRTATRVLSRLVVCVDGSKELAYCYPSACAQLLASGMECASVGLLQDPFKHRLPIIGSDCDDANCSQQPNALYRGMQRCIEAVLPSSFMLYWSADGLFKISKQL